MTRPPDLEAAIKNVDLAAQFRAEADQAMHRRLFLAMTRRGHRLGNGCDPLDFAAVLISEVLSWESGSLIADEDERDIIARKITGYLLDAGWTPPETAP
jgi:hypothetical protein